MTPRLALYSVGWLSLGALLGSVLFALRIGTDPFRGEAASWLGLGLACDALLIVGNWPRRDE